jgi:hypothetical protein
VCPWCLQVGCNWVKVPAGKYLMQTDRQLTYCSLEAHVRYEHVESFAPEGACAWGGAGLLHGYLMATADR